MTLIVLTDVFYNVYWDATMNAVLFTLGLLYLLFLFRREIKALFMTFEPLLIDEDKTKEIYANPDCQEIFKSYPEYYYKTGYNPPWIGYLVIREGKVVGVGGFIGQPKDDRVEIAYGTFKEYEGQGIASFSCQQLISITKKTDPKIIITAKTSPEQNASTKILERNGFKFTGIVQDEGIGDAWEWVLTK